MELSALQKREVLSQLFNPEQRISIEKLKKFYELYEMKSLRKLGGQVPVAAIVH